MVVVVVVARVVVVVVAVVVAVAVVVVVVVASAAEEAAPGLADSLMEGQPPVYLSTSMLLRQWYVKYHPDSGPLRIASAVALEEIMGDEMRREYGDLASRMLRTVLSRRRKPVCVSEQTARTWIEKYRRQAPVCRRPAAAPAGVLKRPAAAVLADALEPVRKRAAMTGIEGARALEEACGERYRREVVDLGLGFCRDDMRRRLRVWVYDVSREACWNWLRSYRLASSLKEGNCGVYALSRQDLRKWYYVDKLTPTRQQDKYRDEHGVFADRSHLIRWLDAPAQMPERLENNESIHSHACGEVVLELVVHTSQSRSERFASRHVRAS